MSPANLSLFGPEPETVLENPDILVGTSGYSFADWVGPFYPPGTRSGDFLNYYARHFGVVEVNSTYYRIPAPKTIEQMERKTPDGFRFVVKLNQEMTHEGSRDSTLYREFQNAIEPLRTARKFDALLAQFPWAFRNTKPARDHLRFLRDIFARDPLFVEFRHDSWAAPEVMPWLAEQGLGYCAVDEPRLPGLMPPIVALTARDGYVRFHGRNEKNWWGRGGGDRYDWDYSSDELKEWVNKVRDLANQAKRTYLFFNNCHAGQAARSAKLMQDLLRQQKLRA